ncbi:hypothetical protein CSQ96_08725 [Janthinobacterium sp. BJB412]|nr:hypothetical protein CSQ96_08725 [Janthinobacterium sp. BJB412]
MKIEIDTQTITLVESELLINLLKQLKEKTPDDDEVTIDDAASQELTEEEVLNIVHKMHKYALNLKFDQSFKAIELYRTAIGGKWIALPPSTRKAIGRQFKKVANEHWDSQNDGATVIEFKERNIQNTAIYQVVQKEPL